MSGNAPGSYSRSGVGFRHRVLDRSLDDTPELAVRHWQYGRSEASTIAMGPGVPPVMIVGEHAERAAGNPGPCQPFGCLAIADRRSGVGPPQVMAATPDVRGTDHTSQNLGRLGSGRTSRNQPQEKTLLRSNQVECDHAVVM